MIITGTGAHGSSRYPGRGKSHLSCIGIARDARYIVPGLVGNDFTVTPAYRRCRCTANVEKLWIRIVRDSALMGPDAHIPSKFHYIGTSYDHPSLRRGHTLNLRSTRDVNNEISTCIIAWPSATQCMPVIPRLMDVSYWPSRTWFEMNGTSGLRYRVIASELHSFLSWKTPKGGET
jgi:hypothetical protein